MTQDAIGSGMHYWLPVLYVFIYSIFILVGPGLLALFRLKTNWIVRLALAPLVTLFFQSILVVILPDLHIKWSWVAPFIAALGCAAFSLLLKRYSPFLQVPNDSRMSVRQSSLVIFSGLVSTAFAAKVTMGGIGNPQWSNQKWDAAYHLSASEAAFKSGNLSPFHINDFLQIGSASFYPSLFHTNVVSLAQISHSTIIVAFNVFSVVVSTGLWVSSCLLFSYVIWGNKPLPLSLTALFCVSFTGFPYRYFNFGGLFPNLLSVVILPIFLSTILLFVGKSPIKIHKVFSLVLLIISATVMLLAQPNTIFFGYFMGIGIVLSAMYEAFKGKDKKTGFIFLILSLIATSIQIYAMQRTSSMSMWPPTKKVYGATIDWIINATRWTNERNTEIEYHAPYILAVLSVIGFYYAIRIKQYRWLSYGYSILGFIFVIGLGTQDTTFRRFITGFYYTDQYRVIGAQIVLAIPLAVLGAISISQVIREKYGFIKERRASNLTVTILSVLGILLAATILYYGGPRFAIAQIQRNAYAPNSSEVVLDDNKLKLMNDIERIVPENAVIIGVPFNGSTAIYPHTGRPLVYPVMGSALNQQKKLLASSFKTISSNPEVCQTSEDLGVKYAIDFGADDFDNHPRLEFNGLRGLDNTPGLELVAQEGEAKLFKVLPCNVQ
ncbi:MAG: hypothetical protein QM613_01435 [Micrococcaceae bacterium]